MDLLLPTAPPLHVTLSPNPRARLPIACRVPHRSPPPRQACAAIAADWVVPRLGPRLDAAAEAEAPLPALVEALMGFVAGPSFAPLVAPPVGAALPAGPSLHLLCNTAWAEWCRFLTSRGAHLLGSGIPDVFQNAYTATHAAQAALEASLGSAAKVRHLRSHPLTAELGRKFNLPTYFQLRVQGVSVALEAALADPQAAPAPAAPAPTGAPPSAPPLSTRPAAALVAALRRCLSPEVMLRPLASQLLQLALQCLARFDGWLGALLEPPPAAAAPATPATPALLLAAAAAADGGGGTAAAAAEPGLPLSVALPLYLDLLDALEWLRAELSPALGALLGLPAASPLRAECEAALLDGAAALAATVARMRGWLVEGHAGSCATLLAPVRAIAASYRMTGKELPTSASFFVADVLGPLRAMLDADARLGAREPEGRDAWVRDVAAAVTARYLELARVTLDTVRKNEEALRRLGAKKPAAAPAGGGGAGASDLHKISLQLCLDAVAYGDELRRLGVEAAGLAEYVELQEAVRPSDGVLEQLGEGSQQGVAPVG